MQKPDCFGCRRSFEQGQKLPLQDLVIQLKNYTYPIKDQKHRWILLKTIVSLLNSKGGTIYVGAQDKTGQVLGIPISRKEQDQFKLFIQKLVQKILPPVDLSNRQDIIMHFIPVTKNGIPTDRYLGKIIIKQGEPAKLYCFTQKVVLNSSADKRYDEFQVVYSYKRINMGSVKELQGYQVVAQAALRAVNPPKAVNIFHEGCNPQPIQLNPKVLPRPMVVQPTGQHYQDQTSYAIQFFKIKDITARQKLQDRLQQYMYHLDAKNYVISYEQQNDNLLIEFRQKDQWTRALDYIDSKLDDLNQGLQDHAHFEKKQQQADFVLYQNQKPILKKCISGEVCELKQQDASTERSSDRRSLSPHTQKKYAQKIQKSPSKKQYTLQQSPPKLLNKSDSLEEQIEQKQKVAPMTINLTTQRNQKKSLFTQGKYVTLPSSVNIQTASVLSITHLNPTRKAQLKQYIQSLTKSKKRVDQYEKTLQYHFEKQQDFNEVYDKLQQSKDLTKFGFRGMLRFGINTGQISFDYYDKNKYKEFRQFITKLVGDDLKRLQFTKKGNRYTLILTLKSPEKAVKWLDKFVLNKDIKQFRIQGNQSMKMKIDLVCVKPTKLNNRRDQDQ